MKRFVFLELAEFFSQPCLLLDKKGKILEANKAALKKLQIDRKSMIGRKIFSFTNEDAERLKAYLKSCSGSSEPLPGRIEFNTHRGESTRYQCHAARYKLTDGHKPMMLFRFGEQSAAMSKFRELNEELSARSRQIHRLSMKSRHLSQAVERAERQALIDPLTELFNRRALREDLLNEYERYSEDRGFDAVLAVIDLDGMKHVNDSRGHARGDELLALFAAKLLRRLRRFDKCYRVGGDEFAVLMTESTLAQVGEMNRRFRSIVHDIRTKGFPEIDISVGYASLSQSRDIDHLFNTADEQMYRHKRAKKKSSRPDRAQRLMTLGG